MNIGDYNVYKEFVLHLLQYWRWWVDYWRNEGSFNDIPLFQLAIIGRRESLYVIYIYHF